jgi:hypothetical protein
LIINLDRTTELEQAVIATKARLTQLAELKKKEEEKKEVFR